MPPFLRKVCAALAVWVLPGKYTRSSPPATGEVPPAQAEAEFRIPAYGHHDFWYGNLVQLLREVDWEAMRTRLKIEL